jgi:hypothetical protein
MSTDSEQPWRPTMVTAFRGAQLPEAAVLAGYSALIDTSYPSHCRLSCRLSARDAAQSHLTLGNS